MHNAVIWLLTVELLGLAAFPLAYTIFRRLPDRGLILSKLLGLLLPAYLLWILGTAHLLPNSRYSIVGILLVLVAVSLLVARRKLPEMASFVRAQRVPLITAELVFLGIYFAFLAVVANSPAINHTEKPMDFAFMNAILRSDYFPPEDPWLAGHSISYYYFGHFMMAFLTKLTGISSAITYNLSVALIPALVGGAAFSLVYNLVRLSGAQMKAAVVFGLAAPLFLVLIGNLEGVLEFVHARGWGSVGFWQWLSIDGLSGPRAGDASFFPQGTWWWWHATRVINTFEGGTGLDYTITEFPFFSFLLGDLHAHVLSLPFLVLVLSLGLNLFMSAERLGLGWLKRNPWELLALALALGGLAFINIWDFPVFAVLIAILVLVKAYGDWPGRLAWGVVHSLAVLAPVLVAAVLSYLPFYLTFSSQASGVRILGEVSTRPLFFFLIWGLFLIVAGSFLIRQAWELVGFRDRSQGALGAAAVITLLPFALWAGWELLALVTGWQRVLGPLNGGTVDSAADVGWRFAKLLPGLAFVGVAAYSILSRMKHSGDKPMAFALLPLGAAFYLLIGVELFYLGDLFGNRMNTVFKAYYQAWLFLAVASAYGLYYLWSTPLPSLGSIGVRAPLLRAALGKALSYGWAAIVVALVVASFYYPVGAALDRSKGGGSNTFDGLDYLRGQGPGEYEAIRWLREQAGWGRIVEAVGKEGYQKGYSEYGRVSSSTGLPTVLGWEGHEHQWRGSTRPFQGREQEVARIYSSNQQDEVRAILESYDIRYVYVGSRERATYGNSPLSTFVSLLEPVFRSGDVVIYERMPEETMNVIEREDGGSG